MTGPYDYAYVTYIGATPDAVWEALTDAELTGRYWGHHNESDWQAGRRWQHVRTDGSGVADVVGTVLVAERPRRLGLTFDSPGDETPSDDPSRVTFAIDPFHDIVRLTVTHENLHTEQDLRDVQHGWPAVFANLKTLLETGQTLPRAPMGDAPGLSRRHTRSQSPGPRSSASRRRHAVERFDARSSTASLAWWRASAPVWATSCARSVADLTTSEFAARSPSSRAFDAKVGIGGGLERCGARLRAAVDDDPDGRADGASTTKPFQRFLMVVPFLTVAGEFRAVAREAPIRSAAFVHGLDLGRHVGVAEPLGRVAFVELDGAGVLRRLGCDQLLLDVGHRLGNQVDLVRLGHQDVGHLTGDPFLERLVDTFLGSGDAVLVDAQRLLGRVLVAELVAVERFGFILWVRAHRAPLLAGSSRASHHSERVKRGWPDACSRRNLTNQSSLGLRSRLRRPIRADAAARQGTPCRSKRSRNGSADQRDELPAMYGDIDFDLVPERLALEPGAETDLPAHVKVTREELFADAELIDLMATATMLGDVVSDAYVARMPDYGMQRLIEMVVVACAEGLEAVEDPPDELVAFIEAMEDVPDWIDLDLIEEGARSERVTAALASPYAIRGAFLATFLNEYAALPMAITGSLSDKRAAQRVNETAMFFASTVLPHGMRP